MLLDGWSWNGWAHVAMPPLAWFFLMTTGIAAFFAIEFYLQRQRALATAREAVDLAKQREQLYELVLNAVFDDIDPGRPELRQVK